MFAHELCGAAAIIAFFALVVAAFGVVRLTEPHPVKACDQRLFGRLAARRVARICLATMLLSFLGTVLTIPWWPGPVFVTAPPAAALLLGGLLLPVALALHITALMRTAGKEAWKWRARAGAWGITALGALAAAAIVFNGGHWLNSRMPLGGIVASLAALAALIVLAILAAGARRALRSTG